ncbi:MAG: DUF47 family protein [Candidatus Bathyarchaeota archaeon]
MKLSWLFPQEKAIFGMIEKESSVVLEAAKVLSSMVGHYDGDSSKEIKPSNLLDEKRNRVKFLEGEGDKIVRNVFLELNKTFITPIDREDISLIASRLDDILDYIEGVTDRLILYKINKPTKRMIELVKLLLASTEEVNNAVLKMKNLKNFDAIMHHCDEVNRFEKEADTVKRNAIAELFVDKDPVEIIKLKEIYDGLEDAIDRCKDVADVVEGVAVKNA